MSRLYSFESNLTITGANADHRIPIKSLESPIYITKLYNALADKTGKTKINIDKFSDVVDNDSWRIWPGGNPGNQLDKQSFRDGEELSQVANKYQLVTELTKEFIK